MVGRGIKPQGSPESILLEKSGLGGGAKCCALDETVISPQIQHANVLKAYINNICCTAYPDVKKFQDAKETLEQHFPTYTESQVQAPR